MCVYSVYELTWPTKWGKACNLDDVTSCKYYPQYSDPDRITLTQEFKFRCIVPLAGTFYFNQRSTALYLLTVYRCLIFECDRRADRQIQCDHAVSKNSSVTLVSKETKHNECVALTCRCLSRACRIFFRSHWHLAVTMAICPKTLSSLCKQNAKKADKWKDMSGGP